MEISVLTLLEKSSPVCGSILEKDEVIRNC